MTDESLLEVEVEKLERVRSVAIDTSSIIYLSKSGLLDRLSELIQLKTVGQVVQEAGLPSLPVDFVATHQDDLNRPIDADTAILQCAVRERIPLLSEDRKLLMRADVRGVPYYNSLMMIALMALRGVIAEGEIADSRDRLVKVAHYGSRVAKYGNDLISYITMNR